MNVLGSLILGMLAGGTAATPSPEVSPPCSALAFCGALTTYSTFGYETLRLLQDGPRLYAVLNPASSVAARLGAASVGFVVAQAIWQ